MSSACPIAGVRSGFDERLDEPGRFACVWGRGDTVPDQCGDVLAPAAAGKPAFALVCASHAPSRPLFRIDGEGALPATSASHHPRGALGGRWSRVWLGLNSRVPIACGSVLNSGGHGQTSSVGVSHATLKSRVIRQCSPLAWAVWSSACRPSRILDTRVQRADDKAILVAGAVPLQTFAKPLACGGEGGSDHVSTSRRAPFATCSSAPRRRREMLIERVIKSNER